MLLPAACAMTQFGLSDSKTIANIFTQRQRSYTS